MSFLKSIKKFILPDSGGIEEDRNPNQLIVDELVFAFNESIKKRSTRANLICDTAYAVYVPQNYHKEIEQTFGILTQEVVEKFNEVILNKTRREKAMKFRPIANNWSFDLIPLSEEGMDDSFAEDDPEGVVTYDELEERFVAVRSSLVANDLYNFTSSAETEVLKTNQSQINTKENKMRKLRLDAIIGLKPGGNGYTYPIDVPGVTNSGEGMKAESVAKKGGGVYATLKSGELDVNFIDGRGALYQSFDITLNQFFVGGPSGSSTYNGYPVIKLSSEKVMNPHMEFMRDQNANFFLKAYGDVKISSLPVRKGEWVRVPDRNASIMISGDIELIFNKK